MHVASHYRGAHLPSKSRPKTQNLLQEISGHVSLHYYIFFLRLCACSLNPVYMATLIQ